MRPAAAVLALTLGLAACSGGEGGRPGAGPQPVGKCNPTGILSLGDTLPGCSFRSFDESVLNLTSLRGTPIVLNFWASWCTFCIAEMPDFEEVAREKRGKIRVIGLDLLGVDGEVESAARKFAKERGVTYDLAFDPDGQFYGHFSVRPQLPTTIFIDAKGVITHRQFGPIDAKKLRSLIAEHLGA